MNAPVEHVRVSQQARDQLIKLKRATGIQHWNVLCRWAFCASLAEPSIPPNTKIQADSSVEMTWKVFAGPYAEIFCAVLKMRCINDRLELTEDVLATAFKLHLHRGIGYLAARRTLSDVAGLIRTIE